MSTVLPVPSEYGDWKLWAQRTLDEMLAIIPPDLLNEFTKLIQHTTADLPKAVQAGVLIHIVQGDVNSPAFSDGADWRRVIDGSIVGTPFVRNQAAPYTMIPSDTVIAATGTGTITLFDAANHEGKIYVISNVSTGVISIGTTSSQTISGQAPTVFTLNQYQSLSVFSDGSNWVEV